MRKRVIYTMLLSIKALSRMFYRFDIGWVGAPPPEDWWTKYNLVAFLNHTSLYEPLFVGWFPNRFLKRIAYNGVMPVAEKATRRPIMGYFFRMVANQVVQVTRKRDHSWQQLFDCLTNDAMVIIMPEGRMKRANGLDNSGKPMTVRGGIADIIQAIPEGKMLVALSAGMHHVQIPGQWVPKFFKTLRMRLQHLDLKQYRDHLLERAGLDGFKQAVIHDLQERRDRYCGSA
ncbi:1-acyl-sn-glycerol-3-phosphate acyltransferase [Desulfatirhabdium butyrativorans]|uniref:1-acyl-sn-glycerol-3-phosphate acyltransferase n=1 Tax=Desulfatirhabdium butyrativorans TaxID=340467 RepID=UPI0004222A29|nr:1-acyl-sn-glycerol-3-phosphate acyltransferase [Desulfatirhabdium butyrativorans]